MSDMLDVDAVRAAFDAPSLAPDPNCSHMWLWSIRTATDRCVHCRGERQTPKANH